jgi:hypothetical protein
MNNSEYIIDIQKDIKIFYDFMAVKIIILEDGDPGFA